MKPNEEKVMLQVAADTARLKLLQKAKYNNDLTALLRPWFTYRLFVRFKVPYYDKKSGVKKDSLHFFGNEHSCSYNQCLHGHVENIVLNKLAGYDNCIQMAEEKFKGKYYHATIYAREVFPDGKFNTVCRHYSSDELKEVQDPVIEPSHNRIIHFYRMPGDYLELSLDPQIDFAGMLAENLK